VRQLSAMQKAIDAAKAEHAHLVGGPDGVKIWGYVSVVVFWSVAVLGRSGQG
jgi:hypothetical protein